jgi:hypothetical protein
MSKSALQGPVKGLARDLGGEFADMLKKLSERSYLSMTSAGFISVSTAGGYQLLWDDDPRLK